MPKKQYVYDDQETMHLIKEAIDARMANIGRCERVFDVIMEWKTGRDQSLKTVVVMAESPDPPPVAGIDKFVDQAIEKCRVVAESNPQMADGAMAAARLIEKMKRD